MASSNPPIALITGSTAGIGRATALALAQQGYAVHVLGRNEERGKKVLETLNTISPTPKHRFFPVDLSSIEATEQFLASYLAEQSRLDTLILNALAVSKKAKLSADGIDLTIAVGVVSRYLFSIRLDALLRSTPNSRAIHIGDARRPVKFSYEELKQTKMDMLRSQMVTYAMQAQLACSLNPLAYTQVAHMSLYPGVVATDQLGFLSKFPAALLRLFGVIQPQQAGNRIANQILENPSDQLAGAYFRLEKRKRPNPAFLDRAKTEALLRWCQEQTQVSISEMTTSK